MSPAELSLEETLDEVALLVRGGGTILLALDFDGTLAPLRDDPAESRALPAAVRVLGELAADQGVELAIVSGRAVADLADKAEVPDGTHLVGSHGAERARLTSGRLERVELELDAETAALRQEVGDALDAATRGTTAKVEHKPGSVVLHTRTASAEDAASLTDLALEIGTRPGVDALRGKDVVELSVLHVTKGDALADLRHELAVDTLLYAGDDVTDERAFATLGPDDVTVRVGDGETAARFRVTGCEELVAALVRLADGLAQGRTQQPR